MFLSAASILVSDYALFGRGWSGVVYQLAVEADDVETRRYTASETQEVRFPRGIPFMSYRKLSLVLSRKPV